MGGRRYLQVLDTRLAPNEMFAAQYFFDVWREPAWQRDASVAVSEPVLITRALRAGLSPWS